MDGYYLEHGHTDGAYTWMLDNYYDHQLQNSFTMSANPLLTVHSVSWNRASFFWHSANASDRYELHCRPINYSTYSSTVVIGGKMNNFTLMDLRPSAAYQAWIVNYLLSMTNPVLISNNVQFITSPVPEDVASTYLMSNIIDIFLIMCLLLCWGSACYFFYREWSSFHLRLPNKYTNYGKSSPKGLENIKVIKRAQDSVIYRNHNKTMNEQIEQRCRNLALKRMSSSPANLQHRSSSMKVKAHSATITTPQTDPGDLGFYRQDRLFVKSPFDFLESMSSRDSVPQFRRCETAPALPRIEKT